MTIYLIRHAQSTFNAVFQAGQPDPMIFDAPLSALGERQANEARDKVAALDLRDVIVSPLTRTLQTATLLFGERRTFQINALIREQVTNSCDVGRNPLELAQDYPHLDFSGLQEHWWHDGVVDERGIAVEPYEVLQARADAFASYLRDHKIRSTAVVSHGNFIRVLTGIQPGNCQIIEFDPHGQ